MTVVIKQKGAGMTIDEAEDIMDEFDKWDTKHAKHNFIVRMERRLNRKERPRRPK